MTQRNRDKAMWRRAAAARHAITYDHVNPLVALSYVVWPSERIVIRERSVS